MSYSIHKNDVDTASVNLAAKTPMEAALALWNAHTAVMAAEMNEDVGWGYDDEPRDVLSQAEEQYKRVTGRAAPSQREVTTPWLYSHQGEGE